MGHHGTSWDIMGHHGTSWDIMGHHGTSWDINNFSVSRENGDWPTDGMGYLIFRQTPVETKRLNKA